MTDPVNDPAIADNATKAELLQNESSVQALHQDAMQESADPEEAFDPGPRWFYYFAIAALTIAGFYLGRHMGEFGTQSHLGYINLGEQKNAAQNNADTFGQPGTASATVSGASVYNSRCAACHQPDGKGLPGAFPPLVESPYVIGDASIVVRIILHGLHGAIQVNGQTYNGVMPAWEAQLSDAEIAAVASHIRGKLGTNKAGPVDEAAVATIRKETSERTTPWTAEELDAETPAADKKSSADNIPDNTLANKSAASLQAASYRIASDRPKDRHITKMDGYLLDGYKPAAHEFISTWRLP